MWSAIIFLDINYCCSLRLFLFYSRDDANNFAAMRRIDERS